MELSFHNSKFEQEVRTRLNIFDRAITDADAKLVTELDLTNFYVEDEDVETLLHFNNLKILALEMKSKDSGFWQHFPMVEALYWICGGDIDFEVFSHMHTLKSLTVSGGDYSSIGFKNLGALIPLRFLEYLELHEFGSVDLAPLRAMKQIKSLAVRYSHQVQNIDVIGAMTQLEELTLDGLAVDNLDFLDTLPNNIALEMCGIQVPKRENIDIKKWKRFTNRDICEIEVGGPWEYVDLSELEK